MLWSALNLDLALRRPGVCVQHRVLGVAVILGPVEPWLQQQLFLGEGCGAGLLGRAVQQEELAALAVAHPRDPNVSPRPSCPEGRKAVLAPAQHYEPNVPHEEIELLEGVAVKVSQHEAVEKEDEHKTRLASGVGGEPAEGGLLPASGLADALL